LIALLGLTTMISAQLRKLIAIYVLKVVTTLSLANLDADLAVYSLIQPKEPNNVLALASIAITVQ
jgi:hypothetical protein